MVLGEVVAEKPGVIGRLQQLQALFIETVDWTGAAVDPIEHAKADLVHRRPLSVSRDPRPPRRRAQRNSGEAVPANRETNARLIDPSPRQGPVRGMKSGSRLQGRTAVVRFESGP